MSGIADFDALRRAMAENSEQPEGPARNARAERLLAEAEGLGIPLAVIEALGHQLKVYNYSSEKDKMFVPFARLLRMWDERPEDFDAYEAHSLHWVFKWMSAGMLDQPHIPLASIEKWLGEMEHRYRLAGHSERAVRSAEFSVATHIGDLARAERAYAAWLAADRDTMADCHACELHGQGIWQAERGRDAEALELWRPVLEGEFACAHEPHTVLASSLAPLLRLGLPKEARANHLRGFRLVRPMESMRAAYADHVEFCALTGNEARALELLAERPAYFTDAGHPRSRLDFMAVVALLMDRLTELGLAGQRVPGPAGRTWTAGELAAHARAETLDLAARFDRRNGTSYVGDRARARMAQRPLVDRLPLGVRTVRPAPAPVTAPPPPEAHAEPGLTALLAEARRLSDTLQPHALQAWAAVARAAQGARLEPRDRAEIADHEAMARGPEGIPLFERAAALYAEAGDPGEALAARARGAYVRALTGEVHTALQTVTGLYDQALTLYAEESTGIRQTASVLMSRARILMRGVHEGAVVEGEAVPDGPIPGEAVPDTVAREGSVPAGPVPDGAAPKEAMPDPAAPHPAGPDGPAVGPGQPEPVAERAAAEESAPETPLSGEPEPHRATQEQAMSGGPGAEGAGPDLPVAGAAGADGAAPEATGPNGPAVGPGQPEPVAERAAAEESAPEAPLSGEPEPHRPTQEQAMSGGPGAEGAGPDLPVAGAAGADGAAPEGAGPDGPAVGPGQPEPVAEGAVPEGSVSGGPGPDGVATQGAAAEPAGPDLGGGESRSGRGTSGCGSRRPWVRCWLWSTGGAAMTCGWPLGPRRRGGCSPSWPGCAGTAGGPPSCSGGRPTSM
ncbi:hypothetical protein [Streptomyces fodineus]|uniref:hypothetical protein n=1 Tax=Streptomyces fodineus TaxID=1904616 RepID=UPI000B249352|nr:hypothetical protein [Streptomyces fodineus]